MATPEITKPAPRENRAKEVQMVRRRRVDAGNSSHLRLSIPDHMRDDKTYRYYWLADRPGRIEQKTKYDDWDFVEEAELAQDGRQTGAGTRIERHAGVDQFGKPLRFFLVRKLREYDEADKKEGQAKIDAMMQQIKRGKTPSKPGEPSREDDPTSYVPEGGIVIQENYKP